jgi:hypothetical protein
MDLGYYYNGLSANYPAQFEVGIDNFTVTVNPVPEPAAISCLALGGFLLRRRR